MTIVHTVPAITKESSGPSYSVVRLCESLVGQGFNVTLIALDWGPMGSPPSFLKTFPLGFGPARLGRSPAMKRWLGAKVQSSSIDIVHSHCLWQTNTVYPGWVTRRSKVHLVVSPRGMLSRWTFQHGAPFLKKVFWYTLQKPALVHASCFHATSGAEYEDIRNAGLRQPVAIIPNGIDIPPMREKPHTDMRTLLFLGRIHPKKGIDLLLHAWQRVQGRFPEWRLLIAGSDVDYYNRSGYLDKLRQLSRNLCLKRVEFIGELHGAAKTRAYQDADLYILPSYSENFGITVAEALAAGTPVIVSKGAPWHGLEEQGAGWWIDIGLDPLVACLKNALARSHGELAEMGIRGRAWMKKEFSWAHVGQRMVLTYEWLISKAGVAPDWVRTD